jgi:GTP cyclohydrolase II
MTHKAERGVFELRQGRVLCVTDDERGAWVLVAPVEGLGGELLSELRSLDVPLRLVVTPHRGRALGLHTTAEGPDLSLALADDASPDAILGLAMDQAASSSGAGVGRGARPATRAESAGLALARTGHLLPALVSLEVRAGFGAVRRRLDAAAVLDVSCDDVEHAVAASGIEITSVAEAPVPLAVDEHARFVFFREVGGLLEHVAVLIGPRERWPDPVPVRLHSACLTGDLFGSMRCDCGEQLRRSLAHFRDSGGGVLVYLAQEGRGIGLGNKMRAYRLQEAGLDTVDADGVLGFGADERGYESAVAILQHLDITRVELLTNNPQKVRAVEEGGLEVVSRTPIYGGINRHNLRYVQAKVDRSGHWLKEMITQRASAD